MDAYLFVHFVGTESTPEHEQVYFSVSVDGRNWEILNKAKPILVSEVGEKGARDPYIIRSVEGNHFYIIATDLSIYHRMQKNDEKTSWRQCTNAFTDNPNPGSRGIVVWESDDLLHWSAGRLQMVAPTDGGCFWAPKCIWDKEKQANMVVGSSKTSEDGYGWLRLYRTYTADFQTFSEAEVYVDMAQDCSEKAEENNIHIIDCDFIEWKNKYYRVYAANRIRVDTADSLNGNWQAVPTNIHELATRHEGPAICQENGKDSCLLMLDNLHTRGGYQPFVAENLNNGQFLSAAEATSFTEGVKYRHGSLLAITQEEYDRLRQFYL